MTQIPGDPLGRLMEELDGTRFSHSGIAVPCRHGDDCSQGCPPRIASALAGGMPAGADFGGVRRDEFETFWPHRDLYCIPMDAEQRARALDFVRGYPERPGADGTFAFTKLFTVAVALHARRLVRRDDPRGKRILEAATAAACAWESDADRPSFYCAEFVAAAYSRAFTHAELDPPDTAPDDDGSPRDLGDVLGALLDIVTDEFAATEQERTTRNALLSVLVEEDLAFLGRAVATIVASAVAFAVDAVLPRHAPPAVPDPLPALDPARATAATLPLPYALVTPRMLWDAFGRDTLCRVAQDGATP